MQEQDRADWDEYVRHSPQASVYHLSGWKDVMSGTFGLPAHYLFTREKAQITGILPLLHIDSRLSGHRFSSMPGALCAEDRESALALFERAMELVTAHGAKYLIMRDGRCKWDLPGVVTNEDHCTLVVRLPADPEQLWRQFDRRVRQATNKAIQADLEIVIGAEHLEVFYPVYSRSMRDLGTPTLGIEFFRNVLKQFPGHFTVFMVRRGSEILGGGLVAFFQGTVYNTWGGMLRSCYHLNPNYILYWKTLEYACQNHFDWVDLGRSGVDSGTYRFKKHWDGEPRPLYQQYYLNGIGHPPAVGSGRKADLKYRAFTGIWSRLPLAVTEFLGPFLRKRVPFG